MPASGYHLVDPDEVATKPERPSIDSGPNPLADAYSISNETNLAMLGLRTYDAEPGEQLPLAYHYHETQEEVFYVRSGTLHVETPQQEYVVESGKLFVVEGGNPHRAFVPADATDSAKVLAFGAPPDDTGQVYDL